MIVCIWMLWVQMSCYEKQLQSIGITGSRLIVHICKTGSVCSQRSMMTEWFMIDIITFKFHRGKVISAVGLDHLYCTCLKKSVSVVLCNMECITITMLNWRTYSICPYAVFVQCKIQKFSKFWGVVGCATCFAWKCSVCHEVHQIEMQRVWSSTIDCLLESLEGCKAHLRGVTWFAAFGIYANLL